jgi:hypothetical protein
LGGVAVSARFAVHLERVSSALRRYALSISKGLAEVHEKWPKSVVDTVRLRAPIDDLSEMSPKLTFGDFRPFRPDAQTPPTAGNFT